jgi:hypothetical protein
MMSLSGKGFLLTSEEESEQREPGQIEAQERERQPVLRAPEF